MNFSRPPQPGIFDASSSREAVRRPSPPLFHHTQRGFTLIELMAVVVILGVLSTIAYGAFTRQIRSAHRTAVIGDLANISMRQKSFMAVSGHYASTTSDETSTYPARDIFASTGADEYVWGTGDDAYTKATQGDAMYFRNGGAVHGFDALRFVPEGGHSRCGYGTISGWGETVTVNPVTDDDVSETPPSQPIAQMLYPNSDFEPFYARDWFYAFAICDFDKDETYAAYTLASYQEDITNESFGPYQADE